MTSACNLELIQYIDHFTLILFIYVYFFFFLGLFFIDPSKGTLETSSPGLDREVNEEYTITIVVRIFFTRLSYNLDYQTKQNTFKMSEMEEDSK